jgi:hypothetical protein
MKLSTLGLKFAALVAGLGLLSVVRLGAQANGSLSDLDIEYSELKVTLDKIVGENKQLSNALAETQKTLADMRKNLAATSGESEIFKRRAIELTLKIEALGLDTAGGNNAKLEQRFLTAVSDLRVMAEEKKKLSEAIVRLSEAASLYAKTATGANAESRLSLEAEIRNANLALGLNSPSAVEATPVPSTISDGRAISVRDDLALVVVNLGSKHGVKVGMPFQVIRGERFIGSVRVVDVRERIAGAVIQNLSSEKDRIEVGDRLKVDARQ